MSRNRSYAVRMLCGTLLLVISSAHFAASPPALTHYQGVLRGAADEPLTGAYDMVFRFFDAETGGNEILIDQHLAAAAQAVMVDGGLFAVELGSGQVLDGSGPGSCTSLADLFRDHGEVWLEVQIGAETLAPRTRVLAAGYALNATTAGTAATANSATTAATAGTASQLNGQPSSFYLDTSSNYQTKTGAIRFTASSPSLAVVDATAAPGSLGAMVASSSGAYCKFAFGTQGAECYGATFGGFFRDTTYDAWTYAGFAGYGIYASGGVGVRGYGAGTSAYGGYFQAPGTGGIGLYSNGATYGGYFTSDTVSGMGGRFEQTLIPGTYVNVAWSGYGIWARVVNGIHVWDHDDSTYARIGASPYKIQGTGAVSFVQNHPDEPDQVVIYHAPESSEVNVYTRGSAKLTGGIARIPLDPTFEWTANPDVGLTAHLTPRGEPVALAVESVTSRELSVRGPHGSDVEFDYWVTGLRIGFEEMPPVSGKEHESPLPLEASGAKLYAAKPGLRAFNALERHRAMAKELGRGVDPVLRASADLRDRIGIGRPMDQSSLPGDEGKPALRAIEPTAPDGTREPPASPDPVADNATAELRRGSENDPPGSTDLRHGLTALFPATTSIEAGDVVVLDPLVAGAVKRCDGAADRSVVGVAVARDSAGTVEVAVATIRVVLADAGYGAIAPGDLLTTSATPGAAMRATAAGPGTILGKSLEPLESGVGTIRVLLMPR